MISSFSQEQFQQFYEFSGGGNNRKVPIIGIGITAPLGHREPFAWRQVCATARDWKFSRPSDSDSNAYSFNTILTSFATIFPVTAGTNKEKSFLKRDPSPKLQGQYIFPISEFKGNFTSNGLFHVENKPSETNPWSACKVVLFIQHTSRDQSSEWTCRFRAC